MKKTTACRVPSFVEREGFDLQEHSFGSAVELDGNGQAKTRLIAFEGPVQRRAQIEP